MKPEYELLYKDMLKDIERCSGIDLPETEIAECCYQIAINYWQKLKEGFQKKSIYADADEIEFFKMVKPEFTSYIEYNLILNQGLLFIPAEREQALNYWKEEVKRHQRFLERNRVFVEYYESGSIEQDAECFLQRNNRLTAMPQERIYEDNDCRSSHDHLVRGLLANRMYKEYVDKRIKQLGE
jgi:RteC protein